MELYANKTYPDNYSGRVLSVLAAMSMTDMKKLVLVGSSSIRSQIYAGDFDAIEKVKLTDPNEIVEKLRNIVKKLRVVPETFIGDIKCGEEPKWSVFRDSARVEDGEVLDFAVKESQTRVDELLRANVISQKEAKESLELLEDADSALEFLDARKIIKFSTLRWKPSDILQGFLDYRGHRFKLTDAIMSGGMLKIDAISNVEDRFTEFSVIYDLVDKKNKRLTNVPSNVVRSLQEDVLYYNDADPFKALKRMFALSKAERKQKVAELLVPVLNSDLGRLYQIIGDLKTLRSLLERPVKPLKEIRSQLDDMKQRFGNIYMVRDFLRSEPTIIGWVETILKSPSSTMERKLNVLIEKLQVILNKSTVTILDSIVKKIK